MRQRARAKEKARFNVPRRIFSPSSYRPKSFVSCNAWVIHHNKRIFGDDTEVYRPERSLEDPEKAKVMNLTLFQFSQGARTCIGKNIGTLEM